MCCVVLLTAQSLPLVAQEQPVPLQLLDVPYLSQSELLCGGAAAAMVLRYWGERGITADSFVDLVDRSAAGIRTDALVADLVRRGWTATAIPGSVDAMRRELAQGRPVLVLIEDRPDTFHYIVVIAAHERGIVFHDPARAPFLVMSGPEFDRRWRAADRWMAIVVPGPKSEELPVDRGRPLRSVSAVTPCEQQVAEGVRLAQMNDLDAAERALSGALSCPAAMRELAGLRVLQKRWAEASDLASVAVQADSGDTYAWKVLATSRFIQNDRLGALAAWNHAGEPRLDLVRIDGLARTRHRTVERLIGADTGTVLSPDELIRARRRLAELPSAVSTQLDYMPVPGGLAELRGVVAERPVLPGNRWELATIGLRAAVSRELRATTGSLTGGGEQIEGAWRFWSQRPRLEVEVTAPSPWGGLLAVSAYTERQPFAGSTISRAEQTGGKLSFSHWMAARWRPTVTVGIDEWTGIGVRGAAGGALQFSSVDERVDARAQTEIWPGAQNFVTTNANVRMRSSAERQGVVLLAAAGFATASKSTPMNLWPAGDTGHARSSLLRAHPVLDEGRLRVERLGRSFVHLTVEAQRWWRVAGPLRVAVASFGDLGRTGSRTLSGVQHDADIGIGARTAVSGIRGMFRVDVAKGLRDGATAISVTYEP